jgi:hypothetical protein
MRLHVHLRLQSTVFVEIHMIQNTYTAERAFFVGMFGENQKSAEVAQFVEARGKKVMYERLEPSRSMMFINPGSTGSGGGAETAIGGTHGFSDMLTVCAASALAGNLVPK